MPIDKNIRAAKPITPALSSRFRNAKISAAARLADSAPASPVIASTFPFRPQNPSPAIEPVQPSSFGSNITPRSGTRSSRTHVESPATPAKLRRSSVGSAAVSCVELNTPSGAGTPSWSTTAHPSSVNTGRISAASGAQKDGQSESKFVRANDIRVTARTAVASPPGPRNPSRPRTAGPSRSTYQTPSNGTGALIFSAQSAPIDKEDEKFFRANDVLSHAQIRPTRPPLASRPNSRPASFLKTQSPEPSRQNSLTSPPLSPNKAKPLSLPRPLSPTKQFTGPSPGITFHGPSERRASIGSSSALSHHSRTRSHQKSASVSTVTHQHIESATETSLTQPARGVATLPPAVAIRSVQYDRSITDETALSPTTISPRSASLASSKTACTSTTADTDLSEWAKGPVPGSEGAADVSPEGSFSVQRQPPAPTQAQSNAANARRERKVLDLEISNSSLLAINKTLERELRKQSTELRRFRRLSRSGRLSFVPSNRSVSGQSALSALSERPSEEDLEDQSDGTNVDDENESDDLHSDLDGDDSVSGSADTETVRASKRARDERRLMLDLSKHHQLLIDSQKLTQSIRKCMSISEEMIHDGRRALEYRVGIGDLKLGGRIVNHDHENEDEDYDQYATAHHILPLEHYWPEQRQGLLSPGLSTAELDQAFLWRGPAGGTLPEHFAESRAPNDGYDMWTAPERPMHEVEEDSPGEMPTAP